MQVCVNVLHCCRFRIVELVWDCQGWFWIVRVNLGLSGINWGYQSWFGIVRVDLRLSDLGLSGLESLEMVWDCQG